MIIGRQETALAIFQRDVERFRQDMEQMEENRLELWNSIDTRTRLCPCISNLCSYDMNYVEFVDFPTSLQVGRSG